MKNIKNMKVLKLLKMLKQLKMVTLWLFWISSSSLFHRSGLEWAKMWWPKVLKLVLGILRRPLSQERRWWPEMECGCRYSSQWRYDKADEMWSNFGILNINWAASLTTFWIRSVWYLGCQREESYSSPNVKSQMHE